jgi:glycosyltransferase involved in cell wall biosynthesis
MSMRVVQVNFVADPAIASPEALLDRYGTLTGWSDALRGAGADVRVVQRFPAAGARSRAGTEYVFCAGDAALAAAAAAFAPDVVHVNGLEFAFRTWKLRRRLPPSASIVVQAHADPASWGRAPLLRASARLFRGAADAFLFAADEHARAWQDAGFAGPSQRVYQVMEASTAFRPMPRNEACAQSGVCGRPAVLWVGRLNENKDPLTALEGFERAIAHLPDATLTMVYATTELLGDVCARIESSSALRGRVRLAGKVPHERLPAFFSAADIFLVGSHHEGSGYSLMEACACGAVPVVTGIPTFRALTAGGTIGALWKPGAAGDCARALIAVAARDLGEERRKLAQHFDREHSWDAIGKRAMEIYQSVVGSRKSGVKSSP